MSRLIYQVSQHPLVKSVDKHVRYIKIKFITGLSATVKFQNFGKPQLNRYKLIGPEATFNPPFIKRLYGDSVVGNSALAHHVILPMRSRRRVMNNLEIIVGYQEFIHHLMTHNYSCVQGPNQISAALRRIRRSDFRKNHLQPSSLGIYRILHQTGRLLYEHFFNLSGQVPPLRMPVSKYMTPSGLRVHLHRLRVHLALHNRFKITTNHLINYIMIRRHAGQRLIPASFYQALFTVLGVSGSLYDAHPTTGAKAVACALMDIRYGWDDVRMTDAIDRGFGELIGLKPADSFDWAIVDWNLADFSLEQAFAPVRLARRLIVIVPQANYDEIIGYKPVSAIPVYLRNKQFWALVW